MIRRIFIIISVLVFGTTASAQSLHTSRVGQTEWGVQPRRENDAQQVQKLLRVFQYLQKLYVEEVDMAPLTDQAIRAMLKELDPHSAYIDAETMLGVKEEFNGEFSGIGVEFGVLSDTIHVVNTIVGGPAERVGMMPNDRIVRIDSLDAVGLKQHEVPKYLRGKRGTRVALEVVRPGVEEVLHFVVERDRIPLNTVDCAYMASDKVGYIKINRFGRTTYEELRAGYRKIGKPEDMILDLRGNGGGLLDQAIKVAGFFLKRNSVVVSTEGRAIESSSFANQTDGECLKGHLVVLIDANSASASEIVSGAIQDWDRGLIVGRPSFGKGLVQRQIELGDGSAVRITMARYHTPSGRVIQRPYQKGKAKEYYLDHLRRYDDHTRDSLDRNAPVFYTLLNERPVKGGGGIHPDVLVENDTTGYSDYYGELIRKGVMHEFVVGLIDRERTDLEARYKNVEHFTADFAVNGKTIEELNAFAGERGLKPEKAEVETSREWISTQLKVLIAQRLYGAEGFYRVMNSAPNNSFGVALDLFTDWNYRAEHLLNPQKRVFKYK